ncbi:MAG: nitroreductase, partial [Chloroflexi bacterium]|nr:nitroreductase [Chloroflexota bacterium]
IALGYPDRQAAINQFVSLRRPINEAVTLKGF